MYRYKLFSFVVRITALESTEITQEQVFFNTRLATKKKKKVFFYNTGKICTSLILNIYISFFFFFFFFSFFWVEKKYSYDGIVACLAALEQNHIFIKYKGHHCFASGKGT